MAINPYDQASWATYTPLSSQEILQPAMMMRERHDKMEEEYGALNDLGQQLSFIVENENDPLIRERYSNYMSQIERGMNLINDKGLTPNTRKELLSLRGRFQSDIAPIKMGYETKLKDIELYNQMKMKDPTWIAPDPSQKRVSDYMSNGLMPTVQNGMSGALLTQQAAEMAKPFSHILSSENPTQLMVDQFGPQYQEFKRGHAYNDDEYQVASDFITNMIMDASASNFDWARDANGNINPEIAQQARSYIGQGLTQMMGKSEILRDTGRDFRMQMQLAREAAKADKVTQDSEYIWDIKKGEAINIPLEDQDKILEMIESNDREPIESSRQSINWAIANSMSAAFSGGSVAGSTLSGKMTESELKETNAILDSFENGKITESDFREKLSNKGVDDHIINSYINVLKQDPVSQYSKWKESNPQGTNQEFLATFLDDYQSKSAWGQTSWNVINNEAQTFIKNNAKDRLIDAVNRDDLIVKDTKGKTMSKFDSKFTKENLLNDSNYKGINLYNIEAGKPTYDYVFVKGNKTYNVSVPIDSDSVMGQALSGVKEIIEAIQKPMTSEDRKIKIKVPGTNETKEYSLKKKLYGEYYLTDGNVEITANKLVALSLGNVESIIKSASGKSN